MKWILRQIKTFFSYFKSNNFKGDLYGWQTNQLGHSFITVLFVGLTGWFWFPLCFWILKEGIDFVISRDWKDCLEDLSFELYPLLLLFISYTKILIIVYVVYYLTLTYIKNKKWQYITQHTKVEL